MIRRAVSVLPNSCLSLTDVVQSLINPLRGLAILDPRLSIAACQCERTHTLAGRPCYSLLLLGHSILSLGRPATVPKMSLSRKEANSRTHARSLRSTRTEATTHVDRIRESNAELEKKHPLSGGGLAWPLTARAATTDAGDRDVLNGEGMPTWRISKSQRRWVARS